VCVCVRCVCVHACVHVRARIYVCVSVFVSTCCWVIAWHDILLSFSPAELSFDLILTVNII
jgi:hypothetical protein